MAVKASFQQSMLAYIIAYITVLFVGCSSSSDIPEPEPEVIKTGFSVSSPQRNSNIEQIKLYLDASQSMQGFIGGESYYTDVLRHLVSVPTSIAPIKFFKFGTNISEMKDEFWSAMHSVEFYDQADTQLSLVISDFSSRKPGHNPNTTLFLILTDATQSYDGYNLISMTNAISQWVDKGYTVEIIGFRSPFHGTIYSEMNQGIKFTYNSTEENEATYRPFYVFVFAPTLQSIRDFNRILQQSGVKGCFFNPTDPLIERCEVELDTHQFDSESPLNLYKKDKMVQNSQASSTITYLTWKGPRKRDETAQIKAKFNYQLRSENQVSFRNLKELKTEVKCIYFANNEWEKVKAEDNLPYPEIVPSSQNISPPDYYLDIFWSFPKPQKSGWYAYQIRFFPEIGSLDTPSWVKDWSTDKDDEYQYGNRTLYLSNLVMNLINKVTAKQQLTDFYIIIGGDQK